MLMLELTLDEPRARLRHKFDQDAPATIAHQSKQRGRLFKFEHLQPKFDDTATAPSQHGQLIAGDIFQEEPGRMDVSHNPRKEVERSGAERSGGGSLLTIHRVPQWRLHGLP